MISFTQKRLEPALAGEPEMSSMFSKWTKQDEYYAIASSPATARKNQPQALRVLRL